uniref:Uncharacterized protein n=1 Tax=Arundo donax TaxID=35708 RepID=A0A0A9BGL1_ARUDO
MKRAWIEYQAARHRAPTASMSNKIMQIWREHYCSIVF